MPAGDLTNILTRAVMYQRGLKVLSANTDPTESQVIEWLNDGVRVVQNALMPRFRRQGEYYAGRLDKMTKLTKKEIKPCSDGVCDLPSTFTPASYTESILIGTRSGNNDTIYPALRVNLDTLKEMAIGPYAPPVSEPVYSFSNGKLVYLPTSCNVVYYYIIQSAPLMVKSSREDFPLDDDLMLIVIEYALGQMFAQNRRNIPKATLHFEMFDNRISLLVGESNKIVEKWLG